MLINRQLCHYLRCCLLATVLSCAVAPLALAQVSVAVLSGGGESHGYDRGTARDRTETTAVAAFTLRRNLICFEARVDGRVGNYILDTGAPSLIINHRGNSDCTEDHQGIGSGGTVALSDYRVGSFEMAQRSVKNYWAVGLDLRSFEARTGQRIDGFVGYDLLNAGELRIDYGQQSFSLRKSRRRPLHGGKAPRHVLPLEMLGHLPVITLSVDEEELRFILDTGAGANLLDEATSVASLVATTEVMNIQGLDGSPADHPIVRLSTAISDSLDLVYMPLAHLQADDAPGVDGILGAPFLRAFTVGIDYRRRRVYLW